MHGPSYINCIKMFFIPYLYEAQHVSPETCGASYKYGIIKNFDTLLYLVGFFLYELFISLSLLLSTN